MKETSNQKQEIARQEANLDQWASLERLQLKFKKHWTAQLDQEGK